MTDTTASAPALPKPGKTVSEPPAFYKDEWKHHHFYTAEQMRAYAAEAVRAALASQPVAPAVPLTDEQIDALWQQEKERSADRSLSRQWLRFARAIERAHDIAAAPDTATASRDAQEGRNVGGEAGPTARTD